MRATPASNPSSRPAGSRPGSSARHVGLRNYRRGECITLSAPSTTPKTVSCIRPHDFEMAGPALIDASVTDYPSTAEWRLLITKQCDPVVADYLGGPVDPRGRFAIDAVHPLRFLWDIEVAPRVIDCAVAARPQRLSEVGQPPKLKGSAHGASQVVTFPIGSCLPILDSGRIGLPVDCSAPHALEVTGVVDITGRIDHLPLAHELDAVIGPSCKTFAAQYLARPLDGDLSSPWLSMAQQSWDANRRQMECLISHGPPDERRAITGSIRSGA